MTETVLTRWQLAQAALIAGVGGPIIGALGRTVRWRVEGAEHYDAIVAEHRQPIFAFWHGRILSATYYWRDRGIVVMTSSNFDGEWIARIIRRFGYGTARGSTSRGARRALIQLKRDVAAGRPAAFTVDGPRGPAGPAQPGAVWLAGVTRKPILPFHIEGAPVWSARRGDRTQIPRPFSAAAVSIGEPFEVPDPSVDGVIEERRAALEQVLAELGERATALLRRG
ncbi:MAG: lysophospholipid acyltransferase family protein [Vicinamibacterales bacterium]|nr:lysophospholipid acyltransferase family protein [Vicinamibacterales bacterium]